MAAIPHKCALPSLRLQPVGTHRYPFLREHRSYRVIPARVSGSRQSRAMATEAASAAGNGMRERVGKLYDELWGGWEKVFGDHMHHGFYDPDVPASIEDYLSAQIRMVEEALRFADISDDPLKMPKRILDVGCGIGGSSRYLAKKYGAKCQGIGLSSVETGRAQSLTVAEGLADDVSFQVADALEQPFPDGQFDLVWAMESAQHIPHKSKLVGELARVTAPGGRIIIVTWCHRDLSPTEDSLRPDELKLLGRICDSYLFPAWCSASDYVKIAQSLSLEDIKTANWSENVAPYWPAIIRSTLTWRGFTSLLQSGWTTIKGSLAMLLMIEGYKKDLIKFTIITCRKPIQFQ